MKGRRNRSHDIFIKHVQKLQKHHFNVLVSTVMSPPMIKEFPELSERLAAEGVHLLPKAMRGKYLGNKYPESYTAEERALILELSDGGNGKVCAGRSKGWARRRRLTCSPTAVFWKKFPTIAASCAAPAIILSPLNRMDWLPDAARGMVLGNLLSKTLKLLRRPAVL